MAKKPLAEAWAERMAKSSMTPEQKRETTELLIRLLRSRRAWREALAAIANAKATMLPAVKNRLASLEELPPGSRIIRAYLPPKK